MVSANDPSLKSWVAIPADSDFPIQNLPFGIFKPKIGSSRVGVAIGNYVLDLQILQELGYFDSLHLSNRTVFSKPYLNDFIALDKPVWQAVRQHLSELLRHDNPKLRDNYAHKSQILLYDTDVTMQMPVKVGDYTDFYSSMEHASNVGSMFRDPANALLPNWKHLPVAYHGRASSIVVSGTDFHRPKGQIKPADAPSPIFGPTQQLDFELEMAFIIGKDTKLGENVPVEQAEDYIFGMVLFNDWSARDIQSWEYVPLGPFLGKNFASSISPWVVTLDALQPFKTSGPVQDPAVLPYLQYSSEKNYNVQLQVAIQPQKGTEKIICTSNSRYLYWNIFQQLAHHTVNGCNINIGDVFASGTISGPTPEEFGSMLELTWRGTKPLYLNDGSTRKFLQDYDSVIMRGFAQNNGVKIGFGEVRGKVLPAKE
ncbi:fumarylacetoacetase [Rhodocytophaga rosea]|uniref:fumarylacetoacetase n=1 Tax=Rhodocytophaga rosea TaxID=2704465 RepID=A0A6C0GGG3_9BACT|nr:fumarylacetoacetase [Rhodocytophaga rosea]QHT67131.1 fumarylacetoacetase [Rhodocytophaga rosea]